MERKFECHNCNARFDADDAKQVQCPKCGSERISRLRRVTGYLTGDYKSAFNKGKQVETEQRVIHRNETKFE